MNLYETDRQFRGVQEWMYAENPPKESRILQESSAIGDYPDSMEQPGSSFLWVGEHHHLNREQIVELIGHMQHWLDTGRIREADG